MIHLFGHRWVVVRTESIRYGVIVTERCRLCKMERDKIGGR